jgi:hypothetical protein
LQLFYLFLLIHPSAFKAKVQKSATSFNIHYLCSHLFLAIFPHQTEPALRRLLYFLVFTFSFTFYTAAQTDSCHLRISLLTCSPGEELYSTFGHTALRVTDSTTGIDYVFNYGTFEFGPDFYTKFIKGKLLYFLSVEPFNDFVYSYQWESRSIAEQVLKLSCAEKQKLFTALQVNAQQENKYYLYDFLFDNCTTRPKNIIAQNTNSPVKFHNILPEDKPTFRNLIHTYLDRGGQYWSKLGIDILLGARLDKKVTNEQAMFLPDFLMKGVDNATVNGHPLATPPQTILKMPSPLNEGSLFRPALVFSLLLVLGLALYFIRAPWAATALSVFDFLLFFSLGLAGILLLFMWWGTDHKVTQDNFNLLWALPTHVVMAFIAFQNKRWIKTYFKATFIISLLLLLSWAFLPQQMNTALIPLVILIIFRSWHLSKPHTYAAKRSSVSA